jgi:hypothetical protein
MLDAGTARTMGGVRSEPFAVGGRSEGGVHVQMDTFITNAEESKISFADLENHPRLEKGGVAEYSDDDIQHEDRRGRSFMP